MNRSAHSYSEFMRRLHTVALDLLTQVRFDKKHRWHLHLVCLYGTMLELLGSACVLIREDIPVGVPILLRTAIEAYLDFVNLVKDRKYGYYMRAAELREWTKILREAQTGENPFLARIARVPKLKDVLTQCDADLEKLKNDGFTPLGQKDKFDKAEAKPVYRSVYNFLCCHSHNNMRALVSRHIDISEDQTDFDVQVYAPVSFDALLPYIDTFCGITMISTEAIHRVLRSHAHARVEGLRQELTERRMAILSHGGAGQ
ncbi:MAG TPA: DUF5677 domain-containing protein [Phycisphaerae bacterium]|nr:DUF5677 domain-containing protein [Phycisphaerae bacterium]